MACCSPKQCREGGGIVDVATVVATGVNADGHRKILGVDVITTEDEAGWTAFLRKDADGTGSLL